MCLEVFIRQYENLVNFPEAMLRIKSRKQLDKIFLTLYFAHLEICFESFYMKTFKFQGEENAIIHEKNYVTQSQVL